MAKTMKSPASAPLVIQNFRPVRTQPSPLRSARVARAKASLPLPGSERANAPSRSVVRRGKYRALLLAVGPPEDGVVHQRIVHVHVDGGRCVHPGQLLDGEHGHEDGPTAATVLLRHLDAHEAELEELGDEVQPELGRLVHCVHMRPYLGLRELADRVAEHGFFFGENGQCGGGAGGVGHRGSFGEVRVGRNLL